MKVLMPNFAKRGGLVTVVAQEVGSGRILMLAYTNKAGYLETLRTGKAVYFSTSREKRWLKGEESGDVQIVNNVLVDCDGDAVVYQVEQMGKGACHTGASTCFFRTAVNGRMCHSPKVTKKEKLSFRNVRICPSIKGIHGLYFLKK